MFDDKVKGRIEWSNEELDDLVMVRSDGFPTYNFAVVVDDIDMAITEVIRGDDHVNNTPRQINIYHALGATIPQFAHLPMILGADGQKLSKRHGAVASCNIATTAFCRTRCSTIWCGWAGRMAIRRFSRARRW